MIISTPFGHIDADLEVGRRVVLIIRNRWMCHLVFHRQFVFDGCDFAWPGIGGTQEPSRLYQRGERPSR